MPGFESLSIGVLLWVVAVMALAGFVQGALGLGFPIVATPLIIYYLGLGITPAALVQALNICFFVGKTTQFATLASVGGVSLTQWLVTLPLALVATITVLYGVRIRNRIDAATYRQWLKRALFVMAVILLVQYAHAKWFA